MNTLETNVYRIESLTDLSARYRLYRVRGLSPEQDEYYRNLNILVTQLARALRSPVSFIERDGSPWIAVREGDAEPAAQHMLVRRAVYLDRSDETLPLNFANLDAVTQPIAIRFLQFSVQTALRKHHHLWQPNSGGAYFEKSAAKVQNGIGLHDGFLVRAMALESGSIGLCVDVRHKYVSVQPLPARMDRRDFHRYKMSHAIFHFGHEWFEVRLTDWEELTVQEYVFSDNGHQVNLLEYLQERSAKPLPPELVQLPKDSCVVHYFNSRGENRAAPATLCHQVFETSDPRVRRGHGRTLLPPHVRRIAIGEFVNAQLNKLVMGGISVRLAAQPVVVPPKMFQVPDLKFGGDKILSLKGTPGAQQTTLEDLGKTRPALLLNKAVGLFISDPFQRQFFFMPETIRQSWGPQFLADLCKKVDALYPQQVPYAPEVITYDDRKGRTFVEQGLALMESASHRGVRVGFAVVMIHEPADRKQRHQDELAAYAIRSLRKKCDVTAAVIHTTVGSECYEFRTNGGQMIYVARSDKRGKLDGYMRNVALNKVLLTNEKWPFVLADPMHADLTIGVDVKANYAGFTTVGRGGAFIETHGMECRQKEQLHTDEFQKLTIDAVRSYSNRTGELARAISMHRDGRMFESEIRGAKAAIDALIADGYVAPNVTFTCLEIGKSSFTSLRLFDVMSNGHERPIIRNPQVGAYYLPNDQEGYLCATGRAFPRDGTVYPLHVKKLFGPLPIEQCLEDVYRLTTLTWSRPEDCTRYPITIKLNDRRLFEDAGEFDQHEIELREEEVKA
ncbi:MAG TPA: hypothetical protein VL171_11640 [Verrucomicrobiae bacterium]|nr:hypothetical protein [Verrucomicrobiae bacterium]